MHLIICFLIFTASRMASAKSLINDRIEQMYGECGSEPWKYRCYGNTEICVSLRNCTSMVQIAKRCGPEKFRFQTFEKCGGENGYIGVGTSLDETKGEDSLVECIHGKREGIYASYLPWISPADIEACDDEENKPKQIPPIEVEDSDLVLYGKKVWREENIDFCVWETDKEFVINGNKYDMDSGEVYIFLGMAKTDLNGNIKNHGKPKLVSSQPMKFPDPPTD